MQRGRDENTTKVFVGSLPAGISPDDLRKLFEPYGTIAECDISNNCGFLHLEDRDLAMKAITELNGTDFMGSRISVEKGRVKPRRGPGGPMRGGPGGRDRGAPYARGGGGRDFRGGRGGAFGGIEGVVEEDLEDADEDLRGADLKTGEEEAAIHLRIEDMTPMGDQRPLTMKTGGAMGMVLEEHLVDTRTEEAGLLLEDLVVVTFTAAEMPESSPLIPLLLGVAVAAAQAAVMTDMEEAADQMVMAQVEDTEDRALVMPVPVTAVEQVAAMEITQGMAAVGPAVAVMEAPQVAAMEEELPVEDMGPVTAQAEEDTETEVVAMVLVRAAATEVEREDMMMAMEVQWIPVAGVEDMSPHIHQFKLSEGKRCLIVKCLKFSEFKPIEKMNNSRVDICWAIYFSLLAK
ncbi:hypothetical protein HUJ04_004353 [Dendroctonus ponderosae]|nr:hypothetical protein HUJ04_004353 [Dendroctonus ponderosae]